MGIEDNKALVRKWLAAVNSGDEATSLGLLADDFEFRCMARAPEWLKYRWNKEQFASVPKSQSTLLTSPIHMEEVGLVAEGDTVILEAQVDATLKNGKHYDNAYSLYFTCAGGKITQVREYSCSHLVVECFGEFNPDNPDNPAAKAAV